ncbi:MAG: SAM-dependent methyltransferase [Planctomycetota bacterium]|nr:MAG: SAM-dependent methyltransferase [Planctomycetota bacterium]
MAYPEDSPAYWEERYRSGQAGWDAGGPVPPLVRVRQQAELMRGIEQVAFLGSGPGHDAVDWARAGFHVMGFDLAPAAVAAASQRAREAGLRTRCRFEQRDLFTLEHSYAGVFDAVVEYTCFCAIHPARRADYARTAAAILRPGGLLVALFFPFREPGAGGPPYLVSRRELEQLFLHKRAPFERLYLEEEVFDSIPSRRGREQLWVLRKTAPRERPRRRR